MCDRSPRRGREKDGREAVCDEMMTKSLLKIKKIPSHKDPKQKKKKKKTIPRNHIVKLLKTKHKFSEVAREGKKVTLP